MRLCSLPHVLTWPSALFLLASCGQIVRPPVDDGSTSAGGAGGGSGGALAMSGSGFATGGLALGGSGGETVSEWEEFLLMAGSSGTFSADNLVGSCLVELEDGTIVGCMEDYGPDLDRPPWCGHLALGPTQYIWSSDPCPQEGVLSVCLTETDLFVIYHYDATVESASYAYVCELKEGWFYEP